MAKGEPLCCVSASPRSRHAQRSHCSTIILSGGKHSAADVVASRKPTSPRPNYCGRCLMSATSRRTRRRSRMSARPDCKFQLTEASSTTPQCCPLAESLRLLLCCIRMPSIFRASPLPSALPGVNPQAMEATPGGFSLEIAGRASDRPCATQKLKCPLLPFYVRSCPEIGHWVSKQCRSLRARSAIFHCGKVGRVLADNSATRAFDSPVDFGTERHEVDWLRQ
jgi:hypothetical protein